jgi:hypothetical protein
MGENGRRVGYTNGMSTLRAGPMRTRERRAARGLEARAALARMVMLAGTVVFAVIVIGILLVVLGANQSNTLVSAAHDAARWLAGPFDQLFTFDNHKTEIAVNWGIAAVVYAAVARLIARVLLR